jgi:hypothetical protein
LKEGDVRRQMEIAAARQAARFDWSVIAGRFEEVLAQIAGATETIKESPTAFARMNA